MACLDTNILIDLMRRHGAARDRARAKVMELQARGEHLLTTRFSVAELHVGQHRSRTPVLEEQSINAVLRDLRIIEFDDAAAEIFGRMTAFLLEIGRPAGDMDVLIAATALAGGDPLIVTRDLKHFAGLPGIAVETY